MGLIRSKKELVLRFELNGQILQEISSKDIKTEITIGRSDSCTWIIPASDRSASGQHAKITSAKGGLIISDLQSRNGIFFQGSKIQERKLKLGDHIRIGDCLLVVEEPIETAEDKAEHPFHRLEQLNGVNKGNSYDLNKPIIKSGLHPIAISCSTMRWSPISTPPLNARLTIHAGSRTSAREMEPMSTEHSWLKTSTKEDECCVTATSYPSPTSNSGTSIGS